MGLSFEQLPAQSVAVSVIVCTYNGEPHLRHQLRSILDQTLPPTQIIVSDDGSTDQTWEVIEEHFAELKAVRPNMETILLRNRAAPMGVTENFSSALSYATGEFVVLADQDDTWERDRIKVGVAELKADKGLLLVASDANLMDAEGRLLGHSLFQAKRISASYVRRLRGHDALPELVKKNVLPGMTFMMRRELLDLALPVPESWVHDYWLAIVAATQSGLKVLENRPVNYRQHATNVVGAQVRSRWQWALRVFQAGASANETVARYTAILNSQKLDRIIDARTTNILSSKLEFEISRSEYSAGLIHRIRQVLKQSAAGNYRRFASHGNLNVFRDVLEPIVSNRRAMPPASTVLSSWEAQP